MKAIRRILHAALILSFAFTVFILLASMGMLSPYVESSDVERLYAYAPTMSFTMILVVLGAFSSYPWLAFAAMAIPALSLLGALLRGVNKWIYRVLVFVPLYINLAYFTEFTFPPNAPFLIALGYFVLALLVDILP